MAQHGRSQSRTRAICGYPERVVDECLACRQFSQVGTAFAPVATARRRPLGTATGAPRRTEVPDAEPNGHKPAPLEPARACLLTDGRCLAELSTRSPTARPPRAAGERVGGVDARMEQRCSGVRSAAVAPATGCVAGQSDRHPGAESGPAEESRAVSSAAALRPRGLPCFPAGPDPARSDCHVPWMDLAGPVRPRSGAAADLRVGRSGCLVRDGAWAHQRPGASL